MILNKLLLNVINYQALLVILPVTISLYNFSYLTKGLKTLSYYLYFSLTIEILVKLFNEYIDNNLPALHVFTLIEFLLISMVYFYSINSNVIKRLVLTITLLVSVFIVINSIYIQNIFSFNTNARAIENVVFIIYPLAFFYSILKELKILKLEKEPMFWINIAILLYFSCNLFIFIFSNYIIDSLSHVNNLWIWFVHGFFNMLMYILFAIGLWYSRKKNAY